VRHCSAAVTSFSGDLLSELTEEQHPVARQIADALEASDNPRGNASLMLLPGTAGTGKTITVRAIVAEFEKKQKRVLNSRTTGITAAQYPRGTTIHLLFRLGIGEMSTKRLASEVNKGTFRTKSLRSANVIIVDNVSILTHWVAQ
jgi:Cdc6-like AAA superfamily ATPase